MTIGQKICKLRKRSGMSQLDLELAIGKAYGHLSRIERGIVEPTKETIADIAYALQLKPFEVASLYGIDDFDVVHLIKASSSIFKAVTLDEIASIVVSDLILKLGFIASAFFEVRDDKVIAKAITKNNVSSVTFSLLGNINLEKIQWDLAKDKRSSLVKAVNTARPVVVDKNQDYLCPAISERVANMIQEGSGDVNTLIYPILSNKGKPMAALAIASKIRTDFNGNMDVIEAVVEQISLAISRLNRLV